MAQTGQLSSGVSVDILLLGGGPLLRAWPGLALCLHSQRSASDVGLDSLLTAFSNFLLVSGFHKEKLMKLKTQASAEYHL